MSHDTNETIMRVAESISRTRPTLPGRDYHAPEVFELERERIFRAEGAAPGDEPNRAIAPPSTLRG
jgi:hypothetical protein